MTLRNFVPACILGVCLAIPTAARAEQDPINVCAHRTTGAVRLANGGCLPTESPLALAAHTSPEPALTLTIGVSGDNQTKTLDVPNLGSIEISCDADGAASFQLDGVALMQLTHYSVVNIGDIDVSFKHLISETIDTARAVVRTDTLWVGREEFGWKVETNLRHRVQGANLHECMAAAIVTVLE